MKGRIRIAAAGLVVMSVLTAMTSVAVAAHNGEFWSGSMPVILLAGMGLAGAFLGRERVVTDARTINPLTRCSGALWGARPARPSGHATDRHRARLSGPPPFPLRSRGPARRQPLGTPTVAYP
jgi:hypothetical protein